MLKRLAFVLILAGCTSQPKKLDADLVKKVLRQHIAEVQTCYRDTLSQRSGVEGRLRLFVDINEKGAVSSVAVDKSVDPVLDNCISDRVRTWAFNHSGETSGKYPIWLKFDRICRGAFTCMGEATTN